MPSILEKTRCELDAPLWSGARRDGDGCTESSVDLTKHFSRFFIMFGWATDYLKGYTYLGQHAWHLGKFWCRLNVRLRSGAKHPPTQTSKEHYTLCMLCVAVFVFELLCWLWLSNICPNQSGGRFILYYFLISGPLSKHIHAYIINEWCTYK